MYLFTSNKTSENWQRITRVLCMFIEGLLKRALNDSILARYFKFTGSTSQVHLCHHCDAPGSKIHVNRGSTTQVIAGRSAAYENQALDAYEPKIHTHFFRTPRRNSRLVRGTMGFFSVSRATDEVNVP